MTVKKVMCPECHGTGLLYADNSHTLMEEPCKICNGLGEIQFTQRTVLMQDDEPPFGDEKLTREELFRNT